MGLACQLACGSPPAEGDETGSGASSSTTTQASTGTTIVPPGTTAIASGDTTAASDDEWNGFDDGLFEGDVPTACSVFTQDCPSGQKCTLIDTFGDGQPNETQCVPIIEEPDAAGEPCMGWDSVTGQDSCELGAICWNVDPETLLGTCLAFCTGTPESPTCADAGMFCSIRSDGHLTVCIDRCDPILQDCDAGQICGPEDGHFACGYHDPEDTAQPGDPCPIGNECAPGNMCVPSSAVPDCAPMSGCCTGFCDLLDPMPPCLAGQVCTPWYDEGMAPAGYEHIGRCELP